MGAIRELIDTLARLAGLHLPPWGAPAGLAVLVLLLSPWILANVRSGDVRKLLLRASRERGAAREALEEQAFTLASRHADTMLALAIEAHNQGRRALTERALDALSARNAHPHEVSRLRGLLRGPTPLTAIDAVLWVERLMQSGLRAEARRRWTEARARWPDDPELAALAGTLEGDDTSRDDTSRDDAAR